MPYNGGVSLREAPARWAGEISATTVAPSAAEVDPRDTPLAAVVPTRHRGEVVPTWVATLPGFLGSLFLALSDGEKPPDGRKRRRPVESDLFSLPLFGSSQGLPKK